MSSSKPTKKQGFQLKPRHLLLAAFAVAILAVGALIIGIINTHKPDNQAKSVANQGQSSVEILKPRGADTSPIAAGNSTPANLPQPAPAPESNLNSKIAAANANVATDSDSFSTPARDAEHRKPRHERRHSNQEATPVQPINVAPATANNTAAQSPAPQAAVQPQPKPFVPSPAVEAPKAAPKPAVVPQPQAAPAPQSAPKQNGSGKKDIMDNLF